MTASLFYFIGNSDIQVNGERIIKNFREETQKIYLEIKEKIEQKKPIIRSKGFELDGDFIGIPIFCSYLDYLKDELNHLTIYLIYTNQNPSHEKDTLYAYKILKLYLNSKKEFKTVSTKPICIDKNPSDWDEMGLFFRKKIPELKSELDQNLNNYVSISPGTPASYISLALNLIDYDVRFIASHQEGDLSKAKEVLIYNIIRKEKDLEKLSLLLDSYRYKKVTEFIADSSLRYMKNIQDLITLMSYCINDDFMGALKKFKHLPPEVQNRFKEIGLFIFLMCKNDIENKFKDLLWKIQIAERCEEFVEFIALIFNMRENLLHYLLKDTIGMDPKEYIKLIENYEELKKKFNKSKLDFNKLTVPVMEKILSDRLEKEDEKKGKKIEICLQFSNFLNSKKDINGEEISLVDLRNQGRFAHGGRATNSVILEHFGGAKQIVARICELLKAIISKDLDLQKNIYEQANKYIIEYLKGEMGKNLPVNDY